jgi:hypothetical protein
MKAFTAVAWQRLLMADVPLHLDSRTAPGLSSQQLLTGRLPLNLSCLQHLNTDHTENRVLLCHYCFTQSQLLLYPVSAVEVSLSYLLAEPFPSTGRNVVAYCAVAV